MARSKASRDLSVAGCFTLIVIGGVSYLWSLSPVVAIAALVVVLVLVVVACWPKSCQVCGNQIKRYSYNWQIEGRSKRVCPKCNQALESRQSKQAMERLLNK